MGYFCTIFIFLIAIGIFLLLKSMKRPKNYPPGPKWLPWIGNLFYLKKLSKSLGGQHFAFEKLSQLYKSPVIGLKLGAEYVIIVLSYSAVKEIHTRHEFDGRPDNFFLRLRTMGKRLGITFIDGELWEEHRRFVLKHLREIGYGRSPMEKQIQYELYELIEFINNLNEQPIYPGSFLASSVINVLWILIAGKRINRNDIRLVRLLKLFEKRSKLFNMSGGILTLMPWLRLLLPTWTGYNLIKNLNNELNMLFQETIEEHKKNFSNEKKTHDFIYAYINEMNIQNDKNIKKSFTELQLTMIIVDLFIAGSQTTSNTLDLAIMMMVIRPDIQENVFNEIQKSLISNDKPSNKHKSLLPYTQAVLMEIQRYFHITPITGPRRALQKTTLQGYTIPKNATILIGLRSVLMDKKHWIDPELFRPERFLDKDMNIINNEYFIPFGQGRRRCLADSLARSCLFVFFVGIIQNFLIKQEENENTPSTNLLPGITLSPKPYKVQFIKRS